MLNERDFQAAIARDPFALEPWLVYADWLDESGSLDAAFIRSQLQPRMPHSESELDSVRTIVSAIRETDNNIVQLDFPDVESNVDTDGINAKRIVQNFPRDDDGRLPLGRTAILACYGEDPRTIKRQRCLAVFSPKRRRDKQVLSVQFDDLIVRNHAYDWSGARWLWTEGSQSQESPISPSDVLIKDRKKKLPALLKAHTSGSLTDPQRAALSIYLLDEARIVEALALYGIGIDETLVARQHQFPLHKANKNAVRKQLSLYRKEGRVWTLDDLRSGKGSIENYLIRESYVSAWISATFLHSWSWRLAPWKIAASLRREHEERSQIKRIRKDYYMRLIAFPNQTAASKNSLVLRISKDGEKFALGEFSTSANDRFPEHLWKRDIWFEAGRISS